jgi:uncharacterized protein (TIGR03435 family)
MPNMKTSRLTWTLLSALPVSLLFVPALQAQQTPPPAGFEVASVKLAPPPTGNGIFTSFSGGPGTYNPGVIRYTNASLADLICQAYGLKPYQVSGPAWLNSTRVDVVAKVPAGATSDQVPAMWRVLLAERFQLTAHTESKELSIYALLVAKSGLKLKESSNDSPDSGGPKASSPNGNGSGGGSGSGGAQVGVNAAPGGLARSAPPGVHKMSGSRNTVSKLADMLAAHLDRPVIDMTGLTGTYDFTLLYSDDGMKPSELASSASLSADPVSAPSLFTAVQEQLGLKLEPRRGPIQILIVDHAEKVPSGN